MDQTNDIRTAALLGIHVSEDVYQDCSYVQEWIEGYRLLLDQLQMWNERAEFDIYRNHSLSNLRRHFYENKSNLNSSQQNFCIFCQTSLDPTQLSSSSSSTTTTSTNISTTNPIRSYHRSSQQILNRTSTSTTNSNYSSTHQSNDIVSFPFSHFFSFYSSFHFILVNYLWQMSSNLTSMFDLYDEFNDIY